MNYPRYPFTYWYKKNDTSEILEASSLAEVPEDEDILFANVYQIHRFLQHLGCAGISGHDNNKFMQSPDRTFILEILPLAIEKYGQIYPIVYRGISGNLPDSKHRYLFGSLDKEVAECYGKVREYHNIKGLHFRSTVKSVKTGDYDDGDSEVIFLPIINNKESK